jgi:hypothetical protein
VIIRATKAARGIGHWQRVKIIRAHAAGESVKDLATRFRLTEFWNRKNFAEGGMNALDTLLENHAALLAAARQIGLDLGPVWDADLQAAREELESSLKNVRHAQPEPSSGPDDLDDIVMAWDGLELTQKDVEAICAAMQPAEPVTASVAVAEPEPLALYLL